MYVMYMYVGLRHVSSGMKPGETLTFFFHTDIRISFFKDFLSPFLSFNPLGRL